MKKYLFLIFCLSNLLNADWTSDLDRCRAVEHTDGQIATHMIYAIKSARKGHLLDSGQLNAGSYLNPKAKTSWNWAQWRLIPSTRPGYYSIESIRGGLLDSGKPNAGVRVNPSAKTSWNWAQWKVVPTNKKGYFAFQSARGGLLDSGKPNTQARTNPSARTTWNWAQWKLVPIGCQLAVDIDDFDFGDDLEIARKLRDSEKLAIHDISKLTVKEENLGAKIGGSYGGSVEESFAWGLEQTLGYSYETSITAGLPVGAEATATHTFSAEFGAHQDWESSETKTFSKAVEMSPSKPGVYKLGHMVYVADDVELPFTAKATLKAKSKNKSLPADAVLSCFLAEGFNAKVLEKDNRKKKVTAEISGEVQATYGVRSVAMAEKVADL